MVHVDISINNLTSLSIPMEKSRNWLVAEEYAAKAREKFGDVIEHIILYGSTARGEETEDSDVDILVVVKSDSHRLQRDFSSLGFDLQLEHLVDVSTIVVNLENYEKYRHFSFYVNIDEEGVRI